MSAAEARPAARWALSRCLMICPPPLSQGIPAAMPTGSDCSAVSSNPDTYSGGD